MKAAALLAKLASKTGVSTTEKEFENFISGNIDLPDADTNKLLSGLMTEEDAMQNFNVKNKFTKAALDGTDAELNKSMDELGLEVSDKEEIKAIKNTYEKVGKAMKKISDYEKKKAGASTGEKKELQDKINQLTTQIGEIQKAGEERLKQLNSEWQGKLTTSSIRQKAAERKYPNKDVPQDVNIETALVILNRKLLKDKAKVVNTDFGLSLKRVDDDTLDWSSPTNEKPTFDQYFDGALAEVKFLEVNAASNNTPPNGIGNNGAGNYVTPIVNGGNGNMNVNHELMNAFDKSISDVNGAAFK